MAVHIRRCCQRVLVAVIILVSMLAVTDGQADNLGTEFIVVFMRNEVENPSQLPLELFITTPSTIPVQVSVSTPKYPQRIPEIVTTVVSGQVEKIELSYLLRMSWTGIETKVILIQADDEVVVYGLNKESFSTDGFLAYPTDVIGYEYYTVSHSPTNSNTEFGIAAKFDDTVISMRLPDRRLGIPIRVEYGGVTYTGGDVLNITLQAFESFQCVSYDKADLTATHIVSSKPVAVFSGNVRTWVGESESRDHLAVQLPPTQAYGKQFAVIPIPNRSVGDVIKVIASAPGTNVRVENTALTWYEIGTMDNYLDFIIPSDSYTTISADQPILVVQISQSQLELSETGDPTMLVVTSTPQFTSDYVFSTPQYSTGGSYDNWLMVVVKESDTDGLMFDGQPFSTLGPQWSSFPGTDLVGSEVAIQEGAHTITHISPVATFSGYVYGTADRESYSFQMGARLAPINQPCVKTESVFGDGVDNDCDGLIDEELCTGANRGTDTDGDEFTDEDCALIREVLAGAPDAGGKQFLIYFMENNVESPRYLPLEVYVTPVRAQSANVRIESPLWFEPAIREDATVSMGTVKKFNIPYTLREKGTTLSSKSLFITADADIVAYGVNKEIYSADAFLALPLDVLGKQYYAVTHWPNSDVSLCQLGVIGVYDGTKLDITFPEFSNRGEITVEFGGNSYTNGDTLTVAINRYATLQLQSRGDLSGTLIRSTQKVAVLSGNIRSAVGTGSSRDHLVAMLPPVDSWGKVYCTVPIPGRTTGDYFYVLASEDDTIVEVTGRPDITLNSGMSHMLTIGSDELVYIRGNRPILVTQLSQSQRTINEIGDPTMIVLPALEQWGNAYTFSTTSKTYSDDDNNLYNNYLVMVAPTNHTGGIIFDGQYMPALFTAWFPIPGTAYSGTSFEISNGVHTIQHEDPTITLSVIVYGNADKESYGFPAGMRLATINAPCETTYTVPGDGIDNDCDGRIDEEICEGDGLQQDEDGDNSFNEDCAVLAPPQPATTMSPPSTESTTTAVPTTPYVIIGPPGAPGPSGLPGIAGPQGNPGYNGIPGVPGSAGLPGLDGETGAQGATGAAGNKGEVGATGVHGDTGLTGATGIIGPQGFQGSVGATGVKGNRGVSVKGEKGVEGIAGALGPTGATGVKGTQGVHGVSGSKGNAGVTGATGTKGSAGDKGEMGPGYVDIDECSEGVSLCSDGCVNTIGSYYCTCPEGYRLDNSNRQCTDDDECSRDNGGCANMCENTAGGFLCSCTESGFHLANDRRSCVDTDECMVGTSSCTEDQLCINSMGSYACVNITTQTQVVYPNITEPSCDVNNGGCTDTCSPESGGYVCSCDHNGFILSNNEQTCVDRDECDLGSHDCDLDTQLCVNSLGSFYCVNKTLPVPAQTFTSGPIRSAPVRVDTNDSPDRMAWIAAAIVGTVVFAVSMIVVLMVYLSLRSQIRRLTTYKPKDTRSLRSVDYANNNMAFPRLSTPQAQVTDRVSSLTAGLLSGDLIFAILLWLCVVSFLLLILLLLVVIQHCRHKTITEDYANNLNDLYRLIDESSPDQSPKIRSRHPFNSLNDLSNASSLAHSISYA